MANFKTAVTDDKGKVPCGTHLDRDMHKRITDWCNHRNIQIDSFLRVAAAHFFFSLTANSEPYFKNLKAFIEQQAKHHHQWGGR